MHGLEAFRTTVISPLFFSTDSGCVTFSSHPPLAESSSEPSLHSWIWFLSMKYPQSLQRNPCSSPLRSVPACWGGCHRGGCHVCSGEGFPSELGEAADTPRCPVLQSRGWVRATSSPSDLALMGRGGAGPPLALALRPWRAAGGRRSLQTL